MHTPVTNNDRQVGGCPFTPTLEGTRARVDQLVALHENPERVEVLVVEN